MAGHSPSKTGVNAFMSGHFFLCLWIVVQGAYGACPDRHDAVARELVGALVHGMARMALHPMPMHFVLLQRFVKPLPEIDILDRLLVGRAPSVALPAVNPF